MAIFKCKMCGGALEINNETVAVCPYCGTKQTLPKLDDERKANLYDRANHFRRNNEFDKAMGIYEQILNDDNTDAESYWSLVLCRYGIEYVEDPSSRKRMPTVNRAQFTSVFDDEDYKSALQYADGYQREVYEQEAAVINEIQKGILAISSREEPFDVFICYKESDNNGRRTPDSVLATELYHELTREGYKVFFSRITLEDKLGQEYEPYIFSALNSAKVMVVLGTKPEYFNAVWVKNEWSRYLALIKNGARKLLIPAYKDMDPYDLPEEFSHLQAQDMGKLGFMQDLIHGVKKIVDSGAEKQVVRETVASTEPVSSNVTALLKRGFLTLEDGEWAKADDFFEQCLNQNAELAEAYLGKLMIELRVRKRESLRDQKEPFDSNNNYQKAYRFANAGLKTELAAYIEHINVRNEKTRLDSIYNRAQNTMLSAYGELAYKEAARLFESVSEYKDAAALARECYDKAEIAQKEDIYQNSLKLMNLDSQYRIAALEKAIDGFESVKDYKDSAVQIDNCERLIAAEKEARAKRKKITLIVTLILVVLVLGYMATVWIILPMNNYNKAESLFAQQNYLAAHDVYAGLGDYRDAPEKAKGCCYAYANVLSAEKKWDEAIVWFEKVQDYKDSQSMILEAKYQKALSLIENQMVDLGDQLLLELGDYKDCEQRRVAIKLQIVANANVGDRVYFRDNYAWLVLEKKENKVLLLGNIVLNENGDMGDIMGGWKDSSLRATLNSTFLSEILNPTLAEKVLVTQVKDPNNPSQITEDQIFILSKQETQRYSAAGLKLFSPSLKYILRDVNDNRYLFTSTTENKYAEHIVKKYEPDPNPNVLVGSGAAEALRSKMEVWYAPFRPAMWVDISDIA